MAGTLTHAKAQEHIQYARNGSLKDLADALQSAAIGPQAAKINDPSGGATIDTEARTAINAIIDALEAFGISADT